jgi:hypothetical protein
MGNEGMPCSLGFHIFDLLPKDILMSCSQFEGFNDIDEAWV